MLNILFTNVKKYYILKKQSEVTGKDGMNSNIVVTGILILAVILDLRTYRIPNGLILIGIVFHAGWRFCREGCSALPDILAGIMIPILVLFLLYRLRMLGAGDIKLFAVIGGGAGLEILNIMLYSFLAGGILAIVHMLYHRSLVNRLQTFWNYARTCFITGNIFPYDSGFDRGDTRNTVHFSIAVLSGYAVWMIERWLDI